MTDATPWHTGLDAETVGHLQNKGFDKLPINEAVLGITKSWREAEKLIGVPAEQIIRLPKDPNDSDGMKAVWQRLGAPKDAKEYDFSTALKADGKPADEAFVEFMRKTAGELNLPKDMAARVAASLVKYQSENETAASAERTAKLTEERTALAKNWGANQAANMQVAKNAAAALGVKPEDVAALESVVGYARVMDMFRQIGSKIGEDKFVRPDNNPSGVMTMEQAVARKAELMKDAGWTAKYMNGDTAANREMTALLKIITDTTD